MINRKEDVAWINDMTQRFHDRTGYYPDGESVIRHIRMYRRECLPPGRAGWSKREIEKRSVERFSMTEAIKRIAQSNGEDPIRVLYAFRSEVDDILSDEDCECPANWIFCGRIFDSLGELLEYLA